MRSFQDTFKTRKRSFICAFSICMAVSLDSEVLCKEIESVLTGIFHVIISIRKVQFNFYSFDQRNADQK